MENYQFEVKLGIGYPVHNNMSQANNAAKYYADEIIKILFKEKKRHMDPENRIALI